MRSGPSQLGLVCAGFGAGAGGLASWWVGGLMDWWGAGLVGWWVGGLAGGNRWSNRRGWRTNRGWGGLVRGTSRYLVCGLVLHEKLIQHLIVWDWTWTWVWFGLGLGFGLGLLIFAIR